MANSTTNLDTISSSQASKEVTANALFDAGSPATTYGRRASTTTGLTWGYYGGNVTIAAGTMSQIANGTVALTASQTNYVVAAKSNGAVSASTATTNWDDTDNYWRLYSIVAGASSVTSYTDARQFALYTGLVSFGAMSYQGAWDASTNTPTLASGTGTKGYYYTVSVAGTTSIDGVALWSVGDVIVFNGTVWEKIDGALSEQELGNLIASATEKTTPIDADMVGLMDSAAGNILKKLSWANIKATAKTYFDTLYVAIGGALGTPSSGTVTNLTGTASININGTVGATTPAAGSFTTIGATGIVTTISASNTSRYDASNASAAAYLLRGAVNVGSGGSLGTSDFYVYSDGTVTQIGTERAKNLSIRVNSAEVGAFSSTGLAVTGAISATSIQNTPIGSVTPAAGAFTALDISGLNAICNATGTTGWSGYNTVNTGGGVVIAVDDSVGGTFGTEAYGSVIRSTAKPLYINIGASSIAKVISTGLAVTGAISASTTLKVGTTLGVGNATPAASGAGITFPATQSASTDPNTLDDYEEGTWTPDVNGTTAGTTTYTTNVGKYTKIGRMVTVNAMSIWTSATGSGDFRINSLPFSAASDSIRTPVTLYFDSVAATAGATVVGRINEGLSNIVPQLIPSGGGAEGAFTFDTAGSMFLSATYMI